MRGLSLVLPFLAFALTGVTCDTGKNNALESCTCEFATLTALEGCENFGGDEEECSGWASCEEENGLEVGTVHASGTVLTCFGCSIQLDCT